MATREVVEPRAAEYQAWCGMKRRCYATNWPGYPRYGGRGIRVCERWRTSYEAFLADMGRRPSPAHTLDRIDNDGNYEPGNCRWATATEQARNRRNNGFVTLNGERRRLADLALERGLSPDLLSARLRRGWTAERALSVPLMSRSDRKLTHCRRGHEFTADNTFTYASGPGRAARGCRACLRLTRDRSNVRRRARRARERDDA